MSSDTKGKEVNNSKEAAALIFVVAPACMFIYQLYLYMRNGEWTSYSVIDLLIYFGNKWAMYPYDWLGFWKVLELINPAYLIPTIVAIFFVVILLMAAATNS